MEKLNHLIFFVLFFSFEIQSQNIVYPFQDIDLSVEQRANDLLNRLTLSEKVAQMQDVAPAIDRLGIPEYNWWNESLHGELPEQELQLPIRKQLEWRLPGILN